MKMFRVLSEKEQLAAERKRNNALQAALTKYEANTDFIALMTGVDIFDDEEEEDEEDE